MPSSPVPWSVRSSSSPPLLRPQLLLCLQLLLQLLVNANSALLPPFDSTLFSPYNGPHSSYRLNPYPNAAFAIPISATDEFVSAGIKRQQQQESFEQFDLSKKRPPLYSLVPKGKSKLSDVKWPNEDVQFTPLDSAPFPSQLSEISSASDQLNAVQCFCCRAFVCRKQVCPCSKFLI